MSSFAPPAPSAPFPWRPAVALVLVGLTLRAPITSVAAVLPEIRGDLQISAATAALLTTLPVLAFAVASAPMTSVARRAGVDRVLLLATLALAALTLVRPFTPLGILLATTALIGVAITAGNVLLPAMVRRDFAAHPGPMTSVSVGSLTVGAALSAAATAPLGAVLGWQWACAAWAGIAVVAAAVHLTTPRAQAPAPLAAPGERGWTWRRPAAWALGLFFGLQAGSYYGVTAWLPTILPTVADIAPHAANTAAAVFQLLGIAGALSVPLIVTRAASRRAAALLVAATWLPLGLGLLLAPDGYLLWLAVAGYGQGGCFALTMTLLTVRARDATAVRDLSGMMQTVGYAIAATVPVAFGALLDGSGPTAVLVALATISTTLLALAGVIGSRRPIGPARPG